MTLADRGIELRPRLVATLPGQMAPYALGIGLAFLAQLILPSPKSSLWVSVFLDIGIAIMLAVSLNLVNGFTGQFSIGHAGFMAVGGYAAAAITYYGSFLLWGSPAVHGASGTLLFVAAALAGGALAAGVGYLVGLPSLRLRGDYLAIVTLGFGEIVRVLLQLSGPLATDAQTVRSLPLGALLTRLGGAIGFSPIQGIPKYGDVFWIYTFVTITLIWAYRLKRSTWGRAFLSVRENEIAAEAMGIHTTQVKVRAFALAAFFAGIAGCLYGHKVGALNPGDLGFMKSFDVVIMVVLGGMGSISGAVLAAIILTILPEALRSVDQYRMVVYAASLIVMMLVRPQGLFGMRELWEIGPFARLFREDGSR